MQMQSFQPKKKGADLLRDIYQYGGGRRLSSLSSLSSHDSSAGGASGGAPGGGGKMKSSFSFNSKKSMISHCSTVHITGGTGLVGGTHHPHSRSVRSRRSKELLLSSGNHRVGSLPSIRQQTSGRRLSVPNEEWDISGSIKPLDQFKTMFLPSEDATKLNANQFVQRKHHQGTSSAVEVGGGLLSNRSGTNSCQDASRNPLTRTSFPASTYIPKPKKSCCSTAKGSGMSTTTSPGKKTLRVTFSETKNKETVLPIQEPRPITDISNNIQLQWYTVEDHNQFLNNAFLRGSLTNRVMKYAHAMNERSYSSSTGLTAPDVLKEYLSSPEEIIGVEHLLTVQKNARESLKLHHVNVLMTEQGRQKSESEENAADPCLLAARLKSTSTISAHMARERALYIIQIVD